MRNSKLADLDNQWLVLKKMFDSKLIMCNYMQSFIHMYLYFFNAELKHDICIQCIIYFFFFT